MKSEIDESSYGVMIAFTVLNFFIVLVILFIVLYDRYYPTSNRTIIRAVDSSVNKNIDGVYHFHAKNTKGDKFLYDGTYYVLPLGGIQLSSDDIGNYVEPYSLVTNGYCTFKNDSSYDYQFGKNLVKAVFHDKNTIYLVAPVSYMQDWVSKRLVSVQDNHYVLDHDLIISGGIQSKAVETPKEPEIITLPVPVRGEIPSVFIH